MVVVVHPHTSHIHTLTIMK